MRYCLIIIMFLMMLIPVAASAKPVSDQTANTYYTACMGRDDPRLDAESQMSLCSCTAASMQGHMSIEELAKMTPDVKNKAGRAMYDKMLIDVYGPCMKVPVQNELARECKRDKKIKEFMLRDTAGMCDCMAARTGTYMEEHSRDVIEGILDRNPAITDIFPPYLDDQKVRGAAYTHIYTCMHDQK